MVKATLVVSLVTLALIVLVVVGNYRLDQRVQKLETICGLRATQQ
ncbi:MAG TPA: hypothetical protein VL486_07355 [Verrucomicrobiae bacterium]|nr:hypothetical protein [Verrucomicrobiae bacterium]